MTWRQEEAFLSEGCSPPGDSEKRSVRGARGGRGFSAGTPQQITPGEDPGLREHRIGSRRAGPVSGGPEAGSGALTLRAVPVRERLSGLPGA
ncbi:hypothetical protein NDU88_009403 [Pleurodeles waltl]|uniref:Uncharacterized protein n=1 Tax=Pleurodeles waltl TaxID=8319 RepID=A0AAV7RW00_PLEWA|nr:hypothetical protein NDU88_009394 [Pleurodeles waltl]KAJ1156685.1 hypothetical protein NDU88_009403 [Pleurodeles waltl]